MIKCEYEDGYHFRALFSEIGCRARETAVGEGEEERRQTCAGRGVMEAMGDDRFKKIVIE